MKTRYRTVIICALTLFFALPALPAARSASAEEDSHYVRDKEGEVLYAFSLEGGCEGWNFSILNLSSELGRFSLANSFEPRCAYEISVLPIAEEAGTPEVEVRIRLDGALAEEKVTLFKMTERGPAEVPSKVEEGFLVFSETEFRDTDYVIAAESDFPLYLTLSILFGAACALGAIAFLLYLRH